MEVHFGLDHLPPFKDAVLTIGVFDGVHHGHRAIIKKVVDKAKSTGGESILMTFDPHPRKIVFPNDQSLKLISTLDEKIKLLKDSGLDHVIVAPFTVEFSQINPYVYTEKILMEKIKARHIIIGYDHRFGLNRAGDLNLLKAYADEGHFTLEEIPRQDIDHLAVSSSKIRLNLQNGNIGQANRQLEHPFILSGKIKKGLKAAGEMGYPTANIQVDDTDKLIPAFGTYAAKCLLGDTYYEGMCYIGESKTLQQQGRLSIEMNIFHHFSFPFYEESLEIHLLEYIRRDQIFRSKEELLFNIRQDKIECEVYFSEQKRSDLKTTIAVLNWNGVDYLRKYIPSLRNSSKSRFEVVLIDNASTDGSIAYVTEHFPDIRIVALEQNYGFAEGYNRGLIDINTPYIAIVNSDIKATEFWLDPIINLLESDEKIGAVQPKILSLEKPDYFEYAGASGGYMDKLAYPFCRGRILNQLEQDSGQYNQSRETFWASGAAMVVRNDVFKRLRGFDPDFFAHMEEIDLCWRMKKIGHKVCVQPSSSVFHLGGGTLQYASPKKAFLNFRNNWWMLTKNESLRNLLWILPLRFVFDMAFAVKSLMDNAKISWAIMKAYGSIIKSIPLTRSKRQVMSFYNNRYGAFSNSKGRMTIILPISFYILKKKKFNQLIS